ncbi:MAG: hypothetical protein V2A58_05790 [Planctomycetota bacterium]
MRARLDKACRAPVDPGKWSKKEDPVTWQDLGTHFRAAVQFEADVRDPKARELYFDHGKLGDAIHASVEIYTVAQGKITSGEHHLENAEIADFSKDTPEIQRCKDAVLDLVKRGILIADVWGNLPYSKGREMPEPNVPSATHQWLLENAGRSFGGHHVGEMGGRYLGQYAARTRAKRDDETDHDFYCSVGDTFPRIESSFKKHLAINHFRDRKEAYKDFRRWMRTFEVGLHGYLSPGIHCNLAHYHCELEGARLIGAELALILINHQVAFAFIRGASRQYGLLIMTNMSVWSRWGFSYPSESGARCARADGHEVGLGTGTPTHLARRIWFLAYMYGTCLHQIEAGVFARPERRYLSGEEANPPPLSELGELHVNGRQWARKHPDRGVNYSPVAIMLDFYNGWLAPKHGYQYLGERRLTWNVFPYEKGDHQIDNFFRWVFPGYEEGSYHRDGTGTFVPTPYGDIFDVLLSNADPQVLRRYNAIILLGENGEVTPALKDYVREGGDLVVGCNDIVGHDGPFFGVRVPGRRLRSTKSRRAEREFREAPYTYHEVETIGAEVLLESGEGHPLVTVNQYGGGRVIVVAADYWMTDVAERERKLGLASQNVTGRNPECTFCSRTEFFDERNWDCPYNGAIKQRIMAGATLATIEEEVCVHCRVPCTNDVSKQCDILEGIKDVLGEYLASFMPFTVDGPPVHYLANLTDKKDMLILTLANHTDSEWQGSVAFKDPDIKVARATEWMTDAPADLADVTIAPRSLAIFEIATDTTIL